MVDWLEWFFMFFLIIIIFLISSFNIKLIGNLA